MCYTRYLVALEHLIGVYSTLIIVWHAHCSVGVLHTLYEVGKAGQISHTVFCVHSPLSFLQCTIP